MFIYFNLKISVKNTLNIIFIIEKYLEYARTFTLISFNILLLLLLYLKKMRFEQRDPE